MNEWTYFYCFGGRMNKAECQRGACPPPPSEEKDWILEVVF